MKDIILKSEQKKVLYLSPENPIQIKGGAGSGKTTVSVFRAKHLLDTYSNLFQEPNVIIFSFTNSLKNELQKIAKNVYSGYKEGTDQISKRSDNIGMDVKVSTFHKWLIDYLKLTVGIPLEIIQSKTKRKLIEEALHDAADQIFSSKSERAILKQKIDFYVKEISYIKGKMLFTLQQYLDNKRIGRGTDVRVTQEDKKILFNIYSSYQKRLSDRGQVDFDDFSILTLHYLKKEPLKNKFSHIVIDEAQDLKLSDFMVIKEIISDYTNSITIIGDTAQKIYNSGFTWSEVGINIVGRTIELKENLRTTKKVHRISQHLIKNNERYDESFPHKNQPEGEKPEIIIIDSFSIRQQCEAALHKLSSLNLDKDDRIIFCHRHHNGLDEIFESLTTDLYGNTRQCKYAIDNFIKGNSFYRSDYSYMNTNAKNIISLSTIHSLKGLNMEYVFLFDLIKNTIPYDEHDNKLDIDRSLLYVAMTRATKNFYFMTDSIVDNQSIFVDEILSGGADHITANTDRTKNYSNYYELDDLPF